MPDDPPADPFRDLPDQERDPVTWDPAQRKFVSGPPAPPAAAEPGRDPRRVYVGAPADGQPAVPPPRVGLGAATAGPVAADAAPPPVAPPAARPRPSPPPGPAPRVAPKRTRT